MQMQAPLAALRWPLALLIALAFALPFLFVSIPPLIDVPGHIGRMAIAAAPAGGPLDAYFSFRWLLVLNLGGDLIVEVLRRPLGLIPAVWLVCALVPVLTAAGVIAVARTLNPRGAYGLPWALIFVFNWPFFYGFLNYSLTAALALLAFALWVRIADRPSLRAALFVILPPLLMVSHAIGGLLLVAMIGGYEIGHRDGWSPKRWRWPLLTDLLRTLWPLLGVTLAVVLWLGLGQASGGRTEWLFARRPEAMLMALRDQNIWFDIASLVAAFGVLILGRLWGARWLGGTAGPAIALLILWLAAPALITTADRIDARLAPMIPLLALTLQDWSGVSPGRRRAIAIAGALLLAARLAVTTAGFVGYERSYTSELAALDHVQPGARILNFTGGECKLADWRQHRLDHLSNLATPLRDAWVNSHWVIDGVNSLKVRYRPGPDHWRDPSEVVFPERCIDMAKPADQRGRKTIGEALARAPVARVDYLWLINTKLPADYAGPPLNRMWSNGKSELYVVRLVPNRRLSP